MLYYHPPRELVGDPNLVFWAAWWLLGRGRKVFGRSDSVPFVRWAYASCKVIDPGATYVELVEWSNQYLVGLQAARTEGPNPFLVN